MILTTRIALTALLATVVNSALADPMAPNKIVTDPIKQCQAGCASKRPDPTRFEQCMLDCRNTDAAQKFLADEFRKQEAAKK